MKIYYILEVTLPPLGLYIYLFLIMKKFWLIQRDCSALLEIYSLLSATLALNTFASVYVNKVVKIWETGTSATLQEMFWLLSVDHHKADKA